MKSFDVKYLENMTLTNELIRIIRKLGEYKGKQELYKQQSPEVLENLKLVAFAQSTESSNRLEQITAPPKRLKELLADKTKPKNRSEAEIAGYRDVLSTIHESAMDIPLTVNVIKQLHRDLMKYTDQPGGNWKSVNNTIIEKFTDGTTRVRFKPVDPYLVNENMQRLVSRYNEEIDEGVIEPLILMPLFIFDFTCIHPFKDGNGRSSRLLTTLLLYHMGYDVVKYISLEKIIEKSKESYYETLENSSHNWHKGKHDIMPFLTYYLSVILAAYDEFEKRAVIVNRTRGTKTEMINNTIEGYKGTFTISDIENACPLVSRDLIRNVMNNLKEKGIIENVTKGRYAKWRKA